MIGKYYRAIDNVKAHLVSLYVVVGILTIIILGLIWGWRQADKTVTVHIPPDIRSGATFDTSTIHPANVYTFASYIFQQLNRWPKEGTEDYGKQIFRLQNFFTPRFIEFLKSDLELRGARNELGRERSIQELPGSFKEGSVKLLGPNTWEVVVEYEVNETLVGETIKNVPIRYAFRVVRYDIDPEKNPWGLAIDGFIKPAERIVIAPQVQGTSAQTPKVNSDGE